jgi:hypothetical protein
VKANRPGKAGSSPHSSEQERRTPKEWKNCRRWRRGVLAGRPRARRACARQPGMRDTSP